MHTYFVDTDDTVKGSFSYVSGDVFVLNFKVYG